MNWPLFVSAIGLVLVVEGIIPFLSPTMWRNMMIRMLDRKDRVIRIIGFFSMIVGAILVYLVHSGILFG